MDLSKVKNALVIIIDGLGDCVISTSFIRELKKNLREINLDILVNKEHSSVFSNNPYINKIIEYKKDLSFALLFLYKVRKLSYDLVIDLVGNPRTALVVLFLKARYKIGYSYRVRKYVYNIRIKADRSLPCDKYHLSILKDLGFTINSTDFELFPTQEEEKYVKSLGINNKKNVICINPGAGFPSKRWEYYPQLINLLIKKYKVLILLIKGPNDSYTQNIAKEFLGRKEVKVADSLSFGQLFFLFKQAKLLIGNDSGIKYIACAAGLPTLTIFGPTEAKTATPTYGKHFYINSNIVCSPCNKTRCSHKTCLRLIKPQDVIDYLEKIEIL
jgi:ADP-heptose:LPS heptosyltransferase